ncbi:hypothetical protein SAMN04487949_3842 [Halogranum gelatinilyticum]|uniref:Uncharacterized protein n=1 Tax=Halogranum gelatinilyticum TaxID=660521 RepID=A0A1H0A660_9EURY|nr:hypothetical protein [Halogranum gelatinilyticum]SDN28925.1 hypothetical protein SAMN04487949_3842 [Halogranum gelatinilyticum]
MDSRILGTVLCGTLLIAVNRSIPGSVAGIPVQPVVLFVGGLLSVVGGILLLRGLFESDRASG